MPSPFFESEKASSFVFFELAIYFPHLIVFFSLGGGGEGDLNQPRKKGAKNYVCLYSGINFRYELF